MFELVAPKVSKDIRGDLHAIEFPAVLPFDPKRIFWVREVPQGETRGFHAHKTGQQVLFCLSGSIELVLRDSTGTQTILLSDQGPGVWMKEMTWGEQKFLTAGAILLVVASNTYDESDYIRDLEEFRELSN
ncbi:FdtA/QdtA family cupin domain-containing protein [Aquiluna borgnonia]|uniref:FdtA/QdtA family cupin domain-containing protein n=1 Tax=Aquiluna borgnonia TaxID=2499157 RepID=A0A7D4QB66_9MICO|nr:FdtA/QdtA family cupin domain-containing protein [Aquiluna borgnonia]QKJ25050.1 FdtA/QdtA family cupin domain-containing protein [Aquiluna borgnonia]